MHGEKSYFNEAVYYASKAALLKKIWRRGLKSVDNRCAPLSDNAGVHKSYIALVPSMNVYSSWSNIRLIHILHLILPKMRKELCGSTI